MRKLILILPVLLLAACDQRDDPAPQPTGTPSGEHTGAVDECPRPHSEPCL